MCSSNSFKLYLQFFFFFSPDIIYLRIPFVFRNPVEREFYHQFLKLAFNFWGDFPFISILIYALIFAVSFLLCFCISATV